jgi:hypothetical protein
MASRKARIGADRKGIWFLCKGGICIFIILKYMQIFRVNGCFTLLVPNSQSTGDVIFYQIITCQSPNSRSICNKVTSYLLNILFP